MLDIVKRCVYVLRQKKTFIHTLYFFIERDCEHPFDPPDFVTFVIEGESKTMHIFMYLTSECNLQLSNYL